jgi:hypothetical protein
MAQEQVDRVKSVFGKEIDLSQFEGVDVRDYQPAEDQLRLVGTDPNYQYGWLDTNDAMTSVKIRRGIWEPVKATELGSLEVPGLTGSEDGFVHVRELLLVRMPLETHKAIMNAMALKTLRREANLGKQFADQADGVANRIVPGSSAAPSVTKSETVQPGPRKWGE